MTDAPNPTWVGQDGDLYVPVFGPIVGERGHYARDWRGFRAQGSYDFNIAVLRADKVVALLWMTEDMQEEPTVLAEVQAGFLWRHV